MQFQLQYALKWIDQWMVPITVDGLRWSSVMHYYLGSQYKKGFPNFYKDFSKAIENVSKITRPDAGRTPAGRRPDAVPAIKMILSRA